MTPLVSIGLPVYNAEKYLAECIESIKAQTLRDFEVIAVLDCPTDNSAEVLRKHADSRFRIIENERNLGSGLTINRSLELCSTGLLARMDADDIMLPERLQVQFDFMAQHPEIAGVGSYMDHIDPNGRTVEAAYPVPLDPEDVCEAFRTYVCLWHPTAMFRTEALRAIKGFEPIYGEDLRVSLKLLAQGYKLANIPRTLVHYRVHPTSQMVTRYERTLEDTDESYRLYGRQIWGDRAPDFVSGRTRAERLRRRIKRNLKSLFS